MNLDTIRDIVLEHARLSAEPTEVEPTTDLYQIQVACIVHHALGSPFFQDYARRLAAELLLLASATTEIHIGGNLRTSSCAVERQGDLVHPAQGGAGHQLRRGRRRHPASPRGPTPRPRRATRSTS
ncbi:MAG: hypothetical protein GY913_29685 [Proteobacteria bacterium]|nr:hypothetical protein [Pseudomonadota bacterium]MCP4921087.1 hypothetical protein [Pseudomonadota bacterium]